MNTRTSKILPPEHSAAFRSWPLPGAGSDPAPNGPGAAAAAPAPNPEELTALRQQAASEGRTEGLAVGRRAAEAELRAQVSALTRVAERLAAPLAALDADVEDALVRVALEVGATLFRRNIAESPEQILPIVREAVALLPRATSTLAVHLNPEDARLIAEFGSAEQAGWRIIEDPRIERGGCRIATDESDVDATVDGRIDALGEALGGDAS